MPCLSADGYTEGYTYCDFCRRQWCEKCPVHRLKHIQDASVPVSSNQNDPDYAKKTMPKMFSVGPSRIPDAGLGVYAKEEIPMGCMLGPYRGEFVETPRDENYAWGIMDKNGKECAYIDGSDPSNSNWLRYINCARNSLERNLIAYQFKRDIYYRTCKSVPRYSELLVFYGYEFAKKLGITRQSFDSPDNSNVTNTVFSCFECGTIFNNPLSLDDHRSRCSLLPNEENDYKSKLRSDISTDSLVNGVTHRVKIEVIDSGCASSDMKIEQETTMEIDIIKYENQEYDQLYSRSNGQDSPENEDNIRGDNCVIGGTAISKEIPELSIQKLHSTCENNLENFKQEITYKYQENLLNLIEQPAMDKNQLYKSEFDLDLQIKDDNLLIRDDQDFRSGPISNSKDRTKSNVCNKKNFKCAYCKYVTSRKGILIHHIRANHLSGKDFKCPRCTYSTNYKSTLSKHINAIHLNVKDFKCPICTFSSSYEISLTNHIKAIHLIGTDFKCPQCPFGSNLKSSLKQHIKAIHLNVKDFKCPHCAYCTSDRGHLTRHIKAIHLNVKDYKCAHCKFCTNRKTNLKNHIKAVHLIVKDFKCPHCKYSTSLKRVLTQHIKTIHLNVKDFKCPHCAFKSSHRGSLKPHIKAIHLNIKDFKCFHCSYCSSDKRHLTRHIKAIHLNVKDNKCAHCKFSTYKKINLMNHIKAIHLNVKNFKCPHCKYSTYYKSSLANHVKAIHLDVKDFKCSYCAFSSCQKNNLKRHMKAVH